MPNIGDILEATIVKIVDFGAFVRLPNGEEGLVHISEISKEYIAHPADALEVGQKVKVKVIPNRKNQQKIALSIRQIQQDAERSVKRFENMMRDFLEDSRKNQVQLQKNIDRNRGVRHKKF